MREAKNLLVVFSAVLVLACCRNVVIDPSITAAAAGDKTLVFSAGCAAVPAQGLDICRVVEGSPITEVMQIIVPDHKVVSCEINVRYKGIVKSFACNGTVVRIPWSDLITQPTYEKGDEGPAQLTGTARITGPDGDHFVDVLGYAFLIVLGKGYAPLPLDSGSEAWSSTCTVEYSTAGRSALDCRRNR